MKYELYRVCAIPNFRIFNHIILKYLFLIISYINYIFFLLLNNMIKNYNIIFYGMVKSLKYKMVFGLIFQLYTHSIKRRTKTF